MNLNTMTFDVSDGVAIIRLNRPDAANAMTIELAKELMDVATECDERPDVRAVLLTANGKLFCAGGDLKSFAAFGDSIGSKLKEMTIYLHAGLSRFTRMEAPLIIAVNGMAAGAGMSLAVAGDYVIASDAAQFTMAYTNAGLSPDGSSTYFLPRLIGMRRTQELMLTNRRLTADEALQWGMIHAVVSADELEAEAMKMASRLAGGPTAAYGSVKRLLTATFTETLESQMELEAREIAANAKGVDGREGIAAFIAKRAPNFTGQR
jgi:2-(1,2-epoxy-1,2-dihydrophenyl)acetyl-CoA isomerase